MSYGDDEGEGNEDCEPAAHAAELLSFESWPRQAEAEVSEKARKTVGRVLH